MTETAIKVDEVIRSNPEVEVSAMTIGSTDGEPNFANYYVHLVPAKNRKYNTIQMKDKLREQLKPFAFANPSVGDYDAVAGGQRPFNLNIIGLNQADLEDVATRAFEKLKTNPALKDVSTTFKPGKPEFQVKLDDVRAKAMGISSKALGTELRAQIAGLVPAKFREMGREYDVRVRLKNEQRNLPKDFNQTFVPNVNNNLVRLSDVAKPVETTGPANIRRQDRGRVIALAADIAPGGDMKKLRADIAQMFATEVKLLPGMRYSYAGQMENFDELNQNMGIAMGFGVLFIFMVLASLYESFVTPLTIMLALPLAICGSFVALAITQQSLNIFTMIGNIMLLGVASKNSILLVDYAHQLVAQGMSRTDALIKAGKTRLRPILMTTMALIAGTVPIALGLNEASRQRTSMGVAIIGGLISSTLLTLIVVPAAYSYIDRFRVWSAAWMKRIFVAKPSS
jgi:HAE1 family hydrophobic/amphiphilic exporter-1